MKHRTRFLIALGMGHALLAAVHAQADAGLQAISDLSQINGQALACQDLTAAQRAKALMLAHAPKTARFGTVFDEGTKQSYLAQTRSAVACPESAALSTRLDTLAQRLQATLPPVITPNSSASSSGTQ
ncbi:MAG: hypothetical protein Q8R67_11845 [Rhodoferax sp.]|nr:hypothetical protein [Rhodoferax sp.]MDP3652364.1 hypothetical protein [Rhodoferax sp.]